MTMRIWVRRLTCDSVRARVNDVGTRARFVVLYPDDGSGT